MQKNLQKPQFAAVNILPSSWQKNLRKPVIGAAANDSVRSEVRTETPVSSVTVATHRAVSAVVSAQTVVSKTGSHEITGAQNFGTQTGTHVTGALTGGAGMSSWQPAQQCAIPKQGAGTRKSAAGQDMHYAVVLSLERLQLLRAARGCSVWRQRVCVRALPQAGIPNPEGASLRPRRQSGRHDPQTIGVGPWHPEPAGLQTEGDALADVQALAGGARCSHQSGAGGDGDKVGVGNGAFGGYPNALNASSRSILIHCTVLHYAYN